ncbi:hypothetical protein L6164_008424 [Bauhinia variegata]|uniref:Uncharacterized protein n=1 Tax=Bauhinia variegata TaxID=167791 RepID=A0ACB9PI11_BAUVA|nr:hypothetical protein L6164_008424 [Bauhinia variegata]
MKITHSSSSPLPTANSETGTKIYSVLPLFGFINITISSSTTIYRASSNGDIPMVVFITFVYFGSLLLEYWFRLYHQLPPHEKSARKQKLKIGIWVLLSSIMFGFACQFSTFMSPFQSLAFFAVVIGGNCLLFYVYFIWNGDDQKSCGIGSNSSIKGKKRGTSKSGKVEEEENRALNQNLDNV